MHWYILGLILAPIFPLYHAKEMKGKWINFLKIWPFLAIFGPFSLFLGYPI
jgi:hypothetical protein